MNLIATLKEIVGESHVLTAQSQTRRYRTGFRFGTGSVVAVVRPGSLVELWRVTNACVEANTIVIPQASNTGLTGGSTPCGADYDRGVVLVSVTRIAKLHLIHGGKQVICLGGVTLNQLERALHAVARDPHSVIGSSCIGASVVGGICNNSGGSLIRRGPAYTELALFARVDELGRLVLVNHLGIQLGSEPEAILQRLESGKFTASDIENDAKRCASDPDYIHRVREIDSEVPARFNADPRRLFEASGSAGRVIVFAVRLDTFPRDRETRTFYIGTNNPSELTTIRRHVLSTFNNLPVAGEYLHRGAFNIAEQYGKDTFLAIRLLGTRKLPQFFRFKAWLDYLGIPSDKMLQRLSCLFPSHLPRRMKEFRDRFEHHLLLKMADEGIHEAREYLKASVADGQGAFFECTKGEERDAFLHRFAAAGAAIRYQKIHENEIEDIVALDVGLRPSDREWSEALPETLRPQVFRAAYYGHFFCHVFHWDYLARKGADAEGLKRDLCGFLNGRGAEYPAEHNVGHLYCAKPALRKFYRELDPTNTFNPGIGGTSKLAWWA